MWETQHFVPTERKRTLFRFVPRMPWGTFVAETNYPYEIQKHHVLF